MKPSPTAPRGVLVIGATSAIASAVALRYAATGARLVVTGRDEDKLEALRGALESAGAAAVTARVLDVDDATARAALVPAAAAVLGRIDVALIAVGVLPDQAACDADVAATLRGFETNAVNVLALLVPLANAFAAQRGGTIGVITSVAGQRGRRENAVYGAAKAAVSVYLQGLRSRLHAQGVAVVDIRPGPVHTPMTAHKAGGRLFINAERAGALTFAALERRADIAYVPWWWGWIVAATRCVPEWAFKRTNFRA